MAEPTIAPTFPHHNDLTASMHLKSFESTTAWRLASTLLLPLQASVYWGKRSFDLGLILVNLNRAALRQLAEDRVIDAQALLDVPGGGRWSAAYSLAGYAVECGLKACVLAFVERTGKIFADRKFSEECFTHNLLDLIKLCDLNKPHTTLLEANTTLAGFWGTTNLRSESSRFQQETETEARDLIEAIINDPNGVLPWVRTWW